MNCQTHKQEMTTQPTPDWEKEFREILVSNDDWVNRYDISRPIKGDIYFDGIEVEKFIENLLSRREQEVVRECVETVQGMRKPVWATDQHGTELYKAYSGDLEYNQTLDEILTALSQRLTRNID